MVSFSTSMIITELSPNSGYKEIVVTMPSTAISADTAAITLEAVGISSISGILGVTGWLQSTKACIVTPEQPTTEVAAGVLTITSKGGSGVKVYKILGKSN